MLDFAAAAHLFTYPFMQRALIGGILTGLTGGLLGSFTVVRQLSFFSDALGHSALLGVSIGVLLGISPSIVVLPFAMVFAIGVTYLIEKTDLWTDALLNVVYSASLAISIILLSLEGTYQTGVNNLLFGDILSIQNSDLVMSAVLLLASSLFIGLTLRTQILLTLNESLAIARGINVFAHRIAFMVILSFVVATAIKSLGVLLVGAFVVIPACAARILSRDFTSYLVLSAVLGAVSAATGIFLSALFNLPTGPSIVIAQLALLIIAVGRQQLLAR